MLESHAKEISYGHKNIVLKKTIHLDEELSCFILISSQDQNRADVVMNHILDFSIDKISKQDAYKDFSITLENINSLLNTWDASDNETSQLDIAITLVEWKQCMFASIGNASVYLINKHAELIEITDKRENKQNFSYISTGSLSDNEYILSCTNRLLDYITQSDIIDSIDTNNNVKSINKNIANILEWEICSVNLWINILLYKDSIVEEKISNTPLVKISEYIRKYTEKITIIASLKKQYRKLNISSKTSSNLLFLIGMSIAIFFLYSILSTAVSVTSQTQTKDTAKQSILSARNSMRLASENIGNQDVFSEHIQTAEGILQKVESEKLFLNDIQKMYDDINILKKQFNKIELFSENTDRLLYENPNGAWVKIIKNSLKTYLINKKSVSGPLIWSNKPKVYSFNELKEDEEFIDATFLWNNMYLLTNTSKVVEFSKNNNFKFMDVSGQQKWENAKQIKTYGQNIYLLGIDENQIYKHRLSLGKFWKASSYLIPEDSKQIGEILSMAIDWGFYILKKDLSIVKFFSSPKYRLESIVINKLPKNYRIEKEDQTIQLKTRKDLKYVYLLMNNKIWVFKPNTSNYKNTQSLTYVGQIEWEKEIINDFYINYDGEILILNKNGVYKMRFEISDDKITIL